LHLPEKEVGEALLVGNVLVVALEVVDVFGNGLLWEHTLKGE
jgi:hypothetical protein